MKKKLRINDVVWLDYRQSIGVVTNTIRYCGLLNYVVVTVKIGNNRTVYTAPFNITFIGTL